MVWLLSFLLVFTGSLAQAGIDRTVRESLLLLRGTGIDPVTGELIRSDASGFFITEDGFFLSGDRLAARFDGDTLVATSWRAFAMSADGPEFPVTLVRRDDELGVALFRARLPYPRTSRPLRVGSAQLSATGGGELRTSGFAGTRWTFATGALVEMQDRSAGVAWRYQFRVAPGQEGSPVYDEDGVVLGIVLGPVPGLEEEALVVPIDHAAALIDFVVYPRQEQRIAELNARVARLEALVLGPTHTGSSGLGADTDAKPVVEFGDLPWTEAEIPVCWEDMDESHEALRRTVRETVRFTWEARSAIRFTGWSACTPDARGIRIATADMRPQVRAHGRHLDGLAGGLVLNFSYRNWSPSCQGREADCTRLLALQTFGHALGLGIPQPFPLDCETPPARVGGISVAGSWDEGSALAACNPDFGNGGMLSEGDIAVLRAAYPRP